MTLCPIGPLTNIAAAFRRAPDIVARIKRIVLMGGAYFEVGNITPAAEFNIYVDPEAADIVFRSGAPLVVMPLDVTHKVLTTRALWYTLPAERLATLELDEYSLAGGLHALEHAAIAILPLYAMCDRRDIGGMSTSFHGDTGHATIFIYDAYPGGVGIAARGFDLVAAHLKSTREMVQSCACREGCPSCIQSPKCGSGNEPLNKEAAIALIALLEEDLGGK